MKMIVISEENFNNIFNICLNILKQIKFLENNRIYSIDSPTNCYNELHGMFHYEICKLKSNLEEG